MTIGSLPNSPSNPISCMPSHSNFYLFLLALASIAVGVNQFHVIHQHAVALLKDENRYRSKLQRSKSVEPPQRAQVQESSVSKKVQAKKTAAAAVGEHAKEEIKLDYQGDYRKCEFNQPFPRPKQACVTNQQTEIPYCQIDQLRLDVNKVVVTKGGEALESVMGQIESIEFPVYKTGAFMTTAAVNLTGEQKEYFYIKDLTKNLQVTNPLPSCAQRISGETLMITRYEYCNAYHTMTDWFNAFLALPVGHNVHNTTVVFLDGHAQGKLDPVWSTLWGKVSYVKQLPVGGVCFDSVTLIPPGYSSVLWARGRSFKALPPCLDMMKAFVKFFVDGHGLQDVKMQVGKVTIIDRIPYIAHPRSKPKNAERMVQNFLDIKKEVESAIPAVTSVEVVRFETMTFAEQLKTIRETHILIGNHGAGIAHMLFLQDGAAVLEFEKPASHMFVQFAAWKPTVQHILLPSISGNVVERELIRDRVIPGVKKILSTASS